MNHWLDTSLTADQFGTALLQTFNMVSISFVLGSILGTALGVLLLLTRQGGVWPKPILYNLLNIIINIVRSLPFIILLICVLPVASIFIHTSIGTKAMIIPLIIFVSPYIARLIENSLLSVPAGIIEAAQSMGATNFQIIRYFILPEAMPSILLALTTALIGLIDATAMSGTVGGGGIGDLAVNYGYQRFDYVIMIVTVIVLVLIVQIIQTFGNWLAARAKKN
ncbi:methionine ABC transporter permease [Snodgrassella alvi]|uniref:methionine ABC transporter permease n=1 Tax=Snodgrassella alvi TaxID=1196083 RepID=UPI000C1F2E93|nr:methionine ABC transporter permease [Snodgrassella alvi]PIT42927.1 methionine ABC transporter permease [Snodgrassella alvi]